MADFVLNGRGDLGRWLQWEHKTNRCDTARYVRLEACLFAITQSQPAPDVRQADTITGARQSSRVAFPGVCDFHRDAFSVGLDRQAHEPTVHSRCYTMFHCVLHKRLN